MKKNTTKQPLKENTLRQLIRNEIRRLMEAEEGETEEVPQEEPQPEEEEGLSPDFQEAVNLFLRKLRSSTDSVGDSDLVDMVGTVIDTFAQSNESKLNILKQIRTNIVR